MIARAPRLLHRVAARANHLNGDDILMSHNLSHRIALYAAAVSVLFLMLCVPFNAAQSQRQRAPSPNTTFTRIGAAPSLLVHPATWDEQNIRMGWTVSASPTAIVISRSVAGSPWKDIATVTRGQEYTDVGAAKLVPCNGTIHYRATAVYGPLPGAPQPLAVASVVTAHPLAPGVSAAVAWQREMPMPVKNLTANSPGKGQVNLSWTDATPVHVFRHFQQFTSIPVSGFSVGAHNQPSERILYYVASVCEVTGAGWVIAPIELSKHPFVYVDVK